MIVQPREIRIYLTKEGKSPFEEWFSSLRDRQAKKRIRLRLDRLELGNLGDCKSIGQGVFELRVDCDPGYWIYFGQEGSMIIIFLSGGDKTTQQQDISQAKSFWRDYAERENAYQ